MIQYWKKRVFDSIEEAVEKDMTEEEICGIVDEIINLLAERTMTYDQARRILNCTEVTLSARSRLMKP